LRSPGRERPLSWSDGHRIVSGSLDKTLRLWDADTGRLIGDPLTGHTTEIFSVALSPGGHRLVSGGGDGTVRLWDADTGRLLGGPFTGHTNSVWSVAFSPERAPPRFCQCR
jgi:WD40 repeat protein